MTVDALQPKAGSLHRRFERVAKCLLLANAAIKKCPAGADASIAADGWRASPARCAWHGRLRMRRWEALANGTEAQCISRPAAWWSAMRTVEGNQPGVWESAWNSQIYFDQQGLPKRIFSLKQTRDGIWAATEWSWVPASAPRALRKEAQRWSLLAKEVKTQASAPSEKIAFDAAGTLMQDWSGQLHGRPAEVSAATWKWQEGNACLRMEEAALEKAQLHLPYSKEDVRLEQRSAMQLRLARLNPQANWLIPFQVLPASKQSGSKGVKYEANKTKNKSEQGQLWIPQKNDGAVLRLKLAVAAPAGAGVTSPAQLSDLEHRELSGLAEAWSARNDH